MLEDTDHQKYKQEIWSRVVDKTFIGSGGGGREGGSAGVKVINQGEVSSKLPTKPPPTKTNFNNKKTKKRTRKKSNKTKTQNQEKI